MKLEAATLLAAVQKRLDATVRCDCSADPIDALVNRVLLLRDLAHLAEQSHAALDETSVGALGARIFAIETTRTIDDRLLASCVDVAAIALHIATQVEVDR